MIAIGRIRCGTTLTTKNIQIVVAFQKSLKTSVFGDFLLQKVALRCGSKILTHTVTHTRKGPERTKEYRTGRYAFLPGFCCLFLSYMTCPKTLPMVWAASSCFCRVAWV